jgi:hypothetical protein
MDRKTRTKGEKMHALRVVGERGRQGRADSGGDGHFKRGLACRTKHDGTVTHQRGCSRPEPMAEKWRIPGGSPPRYALARLLGQPSLIASRAAARPSSGARSGQRNENRTNGFSACDHRSTISRLVASPSAWGSPACRRSEPIRIEPKDAPSPRHSLYVVNPILSSPSLSSPRHASRGPVATFRPVFSRPESSRPFFPGSERALHPRRLIAPSRTVQTPPW